MAEVKFEDFSVQVKDAIDDAVFQWLEEASATLQAQAEDNTPGDTGWLRQHWDHKVDESEAEATVGNTLEYAIYTEFGTGEYALEGNGRKTPWRYQDAKGKWHTTTGKKPVRMLHNAFVSKKNLLIRRAEQIFSERLK